MKCLDKEPARRYASAEGLAEDLSNWLAGRPIHARPVGQAERAWRWCKRNPAVAGLIGAVASSLVAGVVVSTFFALAERRGRIRAESAEDRTERTFAQSLVRPFDLRGGEALSEPEITAVWELSRHQREPIALRFLDEATRDPITAVQLRTRSEPALIAAIGLDPERRTRAYLLLNSKLHDPKIEPSIKIESALLALELEDRPGPVTEAAAGAIAAVLRGGFPEEERESWTHHLVDQAGRIDPSAAISLLEQALEGERSRAARLVITTSLTRIAGHMEPHARAQFLCELLEREAHEPVTDDRGSIGAATTTNVPESPVQVAATALEIALRKMKRSEAASISRRAGMALASALDGKRDEQHVMACAKHLATLTASLDLAEASRICGPAARNVASQLLQATVWYNLADALLILAPRLNSSDARGVAVTMLEKLLKEPPQNTSEIMPKALIALSDRIEPIEASQFYLRIAGGISENLLRESSTSTPEHLRLALNVAADRIDPTEARRLYSRLAERLALTVQKGTKADDRDGPIAWLAAIAKRVDPAEMQRSGNPVIQILKTAVQGEKTPEARASIAWGLAPLSERLGREKAAEICEPLAENLIASIGTTSSKNARVALIRGISALTIRLAPAQAIGVVRLIAARMEESGDWLLDPGDNGSLPTTFYYLFNELDVSDRKGAAKLLVAALADEKDTRIRASLGTGLCCIAVGMDPEEAARVCGPVAGDMAMALASKPGYVFYVADGFDTMASHLGFAEASRAGRVFSEALKTEPREWIRLRLASSLARLASRMERAEARQTHQVLARVLVDVLKVSSDDLDFTGTTRGMLSSLASDTEALDGSAFLTLAVDHATSRSSPKFTPFVIDGFMTTVARLVRTTVREFAVRLPRLCSPESGGIRVLLGSMNWLPQFCELRPR